MSVNDPISDMLTRIRNAGMARKPEVLMPSTKVLVAIAKVLKDEGYIGDYEVIEKTPQNQLKIELRYGADKKHSIREIRRVSKPGLRVYAGKDAGSGRSVSVGGIALTGVDAGNYTVNASASADIGVIDQRPITVAADDLGKIVGAADPALTWKLASGDLVGGDAVTGGLTRASGETPGDYAITQGSLAASSNYKVTFTGATFTITPTGLQNQPIVNPVQNTAAPPPAPAPDNGSGSSASGSSGSDSSASGGSASSASGGEDDPTDPNVHHGSSSSDTCVTGEACSNQPYPGNQQFSSYVSFLSH